MSIRLSRAVACPPASRRSGPMRAAEVRLAASSPCFPTPSAAWSSSSRTPQSSIDKFLSGEDEELHKVALATQQAELAFDLFCRCGTRSCQPTRKSCACRCSRHQVPNSQRDVIKDSLRADAGSRCLLILVLAAQRVISRVWPASRTGTANATSGRCSRACRPKTPPRCWQAARKRGRSTGSPTTARRCWCRPRRWPSCGCNWPPPGCPRPAASASSCSTRPTSAPPNSPNTSTIAGRSKASWSGRSCRWPKWSRRASTSPSPRIPFSWKRSSRPRPACW